jgi:hypothetical protein
MGFILRALGRAFLINRVAQRRQRRRGRAYGRGGFFGPMPYYSGRTRRGTRVHVSGCCLPIPLGMLLATAVGARGLMRRR